MNSLDDLIKVGLDRDDDERIYLTNTANGIVTVEIPRYEYLYFTRVQREYWEAQSRLRDCFYKAILKK